ncbi:hypothetical protein BGZ73_008225 [Actinomortierella ambigua]|nr:hypothetical protein BGZ73_008225 [Actinomortierella ambigua]
MPATASNKSSLSLGKVIGAGTYGIVYKGHHGPRTVAVKKVRLTHVTNQEQIDNEIQMLKRLTDRHVIQYYAHKRVQDEIYLVTDYAEGGSLQHAIGSKKLKSWNVKQRIAHEIAKGLAFIHYEGVVHRDLKSANVLLTRTLEVKLCDFGLSIVKELSGVHSPNSRVGTCRWMAPELFHSPHIHTYESDVYALGMVMWEMAAMCTIPFQRMENNLDVATEVQRGRTEIIPRDTPPVYQQLIEHCWSMDPHSRPTAAAVASALQIQSEQQPMDGTQLMASYNEYISPAAFVPMVPSPVTPSHMAPLRAAPSPMVLTSVALSPEDSHPVPEAVLASIQRDLDNLVQGLTRPTHREERFFQRQLKRWRDAWADVWPKLLGKKNRDPIRWLHKAAERGNTLAQYELAMLYHVGRDVPLCEHCAAKWFRRAAEQGHPGAQYYIGMLFEVGKGGGRVAQNEEIAKEWFRRAAAQNHPNALYRLAAIQLRDLGVCRMEELPDEQADSPPLPNFLGAWGSHAPTPYIDGQGVAGAAWNNPTTVGHSPEWARHCGVQTSPAMSDTRFRTVQEYAPDVRDSLVPRPPEDGQCATSVVHQSSADVERDLELLRAAISQRFYSLSEHTTPVMAAQPASSVVDPQQAAFSAQGSPAPPMPSHVAQSIARATEWLMMAVGQNDPNAQFLTGQLLLTAEGDAQNVRRAFELFCDAARQNHQGAQQWMGLLQGYPGIEQHTRVVSQDDPGAQNMAARAHDAGHGTSQHDSQVPHRPRRRTLQEDENVQVVQRGALCGLSLGKKKHVKQDAQEWQATNEINEDDDCILLDSLDSLDAPLQEILQDPTSYSVYYPRAAEGDAKAQFIIGLIWENGQHKGRDLVMAMAWYNKAVKNGHPEAQHRLANIVRRRSKKGQ